MCLASPMRTARGTTTPAMATVRESSTNSTGACIRAWAVPRMGPQVWSSHRRLCG